MTQWRPTAGGQTAARQAAPRVRIAFDGGRPWPRWSRAQTLRTQCLYAIYRRASAEVHSIAEFGVSILSTIQEWPWISWQFPAHERRSLHSDSRIAVLQPVWLQLVAGAAGSTDLSPAWGRPNRGQTDASSVALLKCRMSQFVDGPRNLLLHGLHSRSVRRRHLSHRHIQRSFRFLKGNSG
jgi:hypothetical protein